MSGTHSLRSALGAQGLYRVSMGPQSPEICLLLGRFMGPLGYDGGVRAGWVHAAVIPSLGHEQFSPSCVADPTGASLHFLPKRAAVLVRHPIRSTFTGCLVCTSLAFCPQGGASQAG